MIGNEAEQARRDITQSLANYIKNNKVLWDSCSKEVMCSDEHLTQEHLLYNEAQIGRGDKIRSMDTNKAIALIQDVMIFWIRIVVWEIECGRKAGSKKTWLLETQDLEAESLV